MSIPEAPYGRVKKGDNKYVYNIYDTRKTFKRTILDKYYWLLDTVKHARMLKFLKRSISNV